MTMLFSSGLVMGYASATNTLIPACNQPGVSTTTVCNDANNKHKSSNIIIQLIKDVIDVLSFIVGVTATIMIIISAIRFVTSGGDSNTAKEARKGITASLIGIVVVVLSQTIVIFILDKLK